MIIRNAIRCNICGDEIESKHRHDYRRRCFKEEGCYNDISVTDHGRKEKEYRERS